MFDPAAAANGTDRLPAAVRARINQGASDIAAPDEGTNIVGPSCARIVSGCLSRLVGYLSFAVSGSYVFEEVAAAGGFT